MLTPNCPSDFIGHAHSQALRIEKFLRHSKATGEPLTLFFSGAPGVGKSALCRWTATALGTEESTRLKLNGADLSVERVRDLSRSLAYRPMLTQWNVIWVDEFDLASLEAQGRLLTTLDDLPKWTAIFATCNTEFSKIEDRIQSRFDIAIELAAPTPKETTDFLVARFQIAPDIAAKIVQCATTRNGLFETVNVRQALKDTRAVQIDMAA